MPNPWTTIGTRLIYQNPWLSLREDQVIRPDGKQGVYSVVEMLPSVGVVAIDANGDVALVEQWRYAHGKNSIEIPTGGSEKEDPDIQSAARRELAEETGISARQWRSLGSIDNSNGATTDVANMFLATDLTVGPPRQGGDESLRFFWLPFPQVVEMALDGRITESVTIAAVLKAELLRRMGQVVI
ncbi:MAG: NUDIX hydrolase [Frankia sp.]|nr:NUDIX hydrolase [Frankia sp.]